MTEKLTTLISAEECNKKIVEMAALITADYKRKTPHLIGILKGSVFFFTELAKHIPLDITIDFMSVSSYGNETHSSRNITIRQDIAISIEDKDIIIVEDIIDSGHTMSNLIPYFKAKGARTVKLAALLSKPSRREAEVNIDYLGFEIEDYFVVGYGLDYAEKYRNIPQIARVELIG